MIVGIVPAYNEEKTIGEVVRRLKKVGIFPIVVDDGSTDRTCEMLNEDVKVLKHNGNMGKGEALLTAFDYIFHREDIDYVVIIDGDLQYNPLEAPRLLKYLKNDWADYVIGSRNWSEVPFRHRLGNSVWANLFNSLFNMDLKDVCCGFVAMKFEVMKDLDVSSGYIVDIDMLIQASEIGYRIRNAPVSVSYRETSGIKRGVRMVLGIMAFMVERSRDKHYLALKD